MTPDIDIWRAAAILVKRHGADDAAIVAAQCGEFRAKGDEDGCAIWKVILDAVLELRRVEPREGGTGELMTTGANEKVSARAHQTRQPGRRVGVNFSRPSVERLPKSMSLGLTVNCTKSKLGTALWPWVWKWLADFLPSRSGITSGYVVS